MLFWVAGVAAFAVLVVIGVAIPALRAGRRPSTVFSRRRAERARREAERPIATAAERVSADSRARRVRLALSDLVSGRRAVGHRPEASHETGTAAAPASPSQSRSAADRDLVSAADRQAQAAHAAQDAVAGRLGSAERGDEIAARRRDAQERIAATATNRMALSAPTNAPGEIVEIAVDDVPEYFDLPRASGGR